MWPEYGHGYEYSLYNYKTFEERKEELIKDIEKENKRRTLLRSFYRNI